MSNTEESTTLPAIPSATPVPAAAASAPVVEVVPVGETGRNPDSGSACDVTRREFRELAAAQAADRKQIEDWKPEVAQRAARLDRLEQKQETTTQAIARVELKTDRLEQKQDKQTAMLEQLVESMGKIAKSVAGFLDDPKIRNLVLSALGSIVFILGIVATYLAAHNPAPAPVPVQATTQTSPPQIVTVLVPTAAPAPAPMPSPKGSQ